jgi:hypothetical protein
MPLTPKPKIYSLWLRSDVHGPAQTIRLCSVSRSRMGCASDLSSDIMPCVTACWKENFKCVLLQT